MFELYHIVKKTDFRTKEQQQKHQNTLTTHNRRFTDRKPLLSLCDFRIGNNSGWMLAMVSLLGTHEGLGGCPRLASWRWACPRARPAKAPRCVSTREARARPRHSASIGGCRPRPYNRGATRERGGDREGRGGCTITHTLSHALLNCNRCLKTIILLN